MSDVKSTTFKRVMTAVIALPVYLFVLYSGYFNSLGVLIASLVISLVGLYEYYRLCEAAGGKPFKKWGIIAGAIVNIIVYYYAFGYSMHTDIPDTRAVFAAIALLICLISVLQLFTRPIKGCINSLAVTLFGVVYFVFFFSHIILMKALDNGFLYILMLNIVVMVNDSAAYFGGVTMGKHKLNFPVSPNKSWEGYFFGLGFSIIAMIATNAVYGALLNVQLFTLTESIILGAILSMLGHAGDLLESAVKRDAGQKDSGSFFPGHGGMWDIFDALIFSLPFFYYYLLIRSGF